MARSYNGHYPGLSIRRREFDSPTSRQVLYPVSLVAENAALSRRRSWVQIPYRMPTHKYLMRFPILFGPEIYCTDALPNSELIYIDDHIGHEHHENAFRQLNALLKNSKGNVVIEYLATQDVQSALQPRIMCLPFQTYHTCHAMQKTMGQRPWAAKRGVFNFCINKKRGNREWLLRALSQRQLQTDFYTVSWSQEPLYPNRFWLAEHSQRLGGNINNSSHTNLFLYNQFLRDNVYEPTLISLITEPEWQPRATFLSEKTVFAFEAGTVPIWVGGHTQAMHLKALGFDVFDDLVNHSYQTESNPVRRMELALELNKELLRDFDRVHDFFTKNITRFEHNRKLLRSCNWFYDHLHREIARTDWPQEQILDIMRYLVIEHNYQWPKLD